ncbi:MAG: DUF4115 domain-containing protein [Acidobacteriia bacterium]|nr:DUF4115 domain-containing protein [Terriglobia bacterium]
MTSLGDTLRRARLKRNLELNRIADELKISASMLKAIEDERFDKLPGGVFVRSFVRQYARFLELDEDEMVGELRRVLEPDAVPLPVSNATHVPDSNIPLPRMQGWQAVKDRGMRWSSSLMALALVVVVMLACAAAYAWWQRGRRPVSANGNTTVQAQTKASQPPADLPSLQEPVVPAATTPSAPVSPVAEQKTPDFTPPAANSETPTPAPASTVPLAAVNPDAAVRVDVTAEESVWISIRADGQSSFTGVLDANQTRTVAANKTVWLKVGNAGGISVLLNGKPIGPLGEKGAVRTLQLTSGGFKILPPDVPKPAAPPTDLPTDSPDPR